MVWNTTVCVEVVHPCARVCVWDSGALGEIEREREREREGGGGGRETERENCPYSAMLNWL